jgi:hypothetical protein
MQLQHLQAERPATQQQALANIQQQLQLGSLLVCRY